MAMKRRKVVKVLVTLRIVDALSQGATLSEHA